jgi:hypothetical protein
LAECFDGADAQIYVGLPVGKTIRRNSFHRGLLAQLLFNKSSIHRAAIRHARPNPQAVFVKASPTDETLLSRREVKNRQYVGLQLCEGDER